MISMPSRARGINLIRIFLENWEQAARASFDADGNLTDARSLLDLVRAADARGIMVDVTILDWSKMAEQQSAGRGAQCSARVKGSAQLVFDLVSEHNWEVVSTLPTTHNKMFPHCQAGDAAQRL